MVLAYTSMFGVSVSFYQHYLTKIIRLLVSLLHGSDKFVLLVHPSVFSRVRVSQSLVFCVVLCRSLLDLFLLTIVMSVVL
jgi:hypothetical protein